MPFEINNAPDGAIVTGTATSATTFLGPFDTTNFMTATLHLTGTWAGTIVWEVSNDETNPTNWAATVGQLIASGTTATSATTNTFAFIPLQSRWFRIRCSTYTSGTIVANLMFSADALPLVAGNTAIGAGTSNIGYASAQTPFYVNDIASGAITTTTTTSAITPGYGTCYSVTVLVTAVSGTNPTMDVVVQESDDGGTSWFDVYHFPRVTANATLRSPLLPLKGNRVRYVQTIGGTTPSFTRTVNRVQYGTGPFKAFRVFFDRTTFASTQTAGTPNAPATPGWHIADCQNVQLVVSAGTITTTAPQFKLQGSDDNVNWFDLSTAVTAVASSTVQITANNINATYVRVMPTVSGSAATINYVEVKAWQ